MGRLARTSFATLAGVAIGLLAGAAEARTFKLGHVFETGHPMHQGAVRAVETFKECTGGRHGIDIYPASQLGSDNQMQQQLRIGGVDITLTGYIFASTAHPPLAIGAAPFLFRDRDHALRYMASDLFKETWRGWNRATGQHILSSAYFGLFNVTSNAPIEKPEDMRGVKIRVPDTPIYMAFPRALGANPTPIPLHEVYLALQQGVATASANGLTVTYAAKFYEVQKYLNPTGHMVDFTLWAASDATLRALEGKDRDCLQQAADVWATESTRRTVDLEQNLRKEMEERKLIQWTKPDIPAFQAAVGDAVGKFAEMLGVGRDVVEKIRGL